MILSFVANTLECSVNLFIVLSWSGFMWLFNESFEKQNEIEKKL